MDSQQKNDTLKFELKKNKCCFFNKKTRTYFENENQNEIRPGQFRNENENGKNMKRKRNKQKTKSKSTTKFQKLSWTYFVTDIDSYLKIKTMVLKKKNGGWPLGIIINHVA